MESSLDRSLELALGGVAARDRARDTVQSSLASTNPGLVGLPSALVQVGFVSTDGVLGATAPRAFLVGP